VNDDETIDRHMSRIWADRHPGDSLEVVNLAFDGYDSYQLFERFRSDGRPLQPDLVIVNAGINDVRNAWFQDIVDGDRRTQLYAATMEHARYELARGGPTIWNRTKHYSYLARVPGWLRGQMLAASARAESSGSALQPYYWDAADYFERNLRRIVQLAGDSTVVFFSTPPSSLRTKYDPDEPPRASYWIRDAETTQMYRDSLSARAQSIVAQGASDGRHTSFVRHDQLPPSLFLDDAHLTSEGNRRVAEAFVRAIEERIAPARRASDRI
jgi:lysophospholipase L1-like esterase